MLHVVAVAGVVFTVLGALLTGIVNIIKKVREKD